MHIIWYRRLLCHLATVVIIDPGVKVENDYEPFEVGLKMDIFIKVTEAVRSKTM